MQADIHPMVQKNNQSSFTSMVEEFGFNHCQWAHSNQIDGSSLKDEKAGSIIEQFCQSVAG